VYQGIGLGEGSLKGGRTTDRRLRVQARKRRGEREPSSVHAGENLPYTNDFCLRKEPKFPIFFI
jgi:hypothetical protein